MIRCLALLVLSQPGGVDSAVRVSGGLIARSQPNVGVSELVTVELEVKMSDLLSQQ